VSTETASEGKKTDWEAIERDYRAGVLSLREIGKIHGISEGMIRKKAKAGGWERDLTERVNEKVRNDLVRNEVRTADPRTEREIIETAAATVVHVVRSHRKHITKQTKLVDMLTDQLMEAAGKREDIEDAIEDETKDDQNGQRRAMMLKAVSLQAHSSIAVNLSNALKTLVGLERQAFNIKDESEAPAVSPLVSLLSQVSGTALPVVKDADEE
jgi:hypothetical protein